MDATFFRLFELADFEIDLNSISKATLLNESHLGIFAYRQLQTLVGYYG